jgi:hypothetical protein
MSIAPHHDQSEHKQHTTHKLHARSQDLITRSSSTPTSYLMVYGYVSHMLMVHLFMLIVEWNIIKFDQLKLLNVVNLLAFPCLSLCIHIFPHTC